MQLLAQHRLIDHPGRFGLVKQRLGIQRHQHPVGAGLAVRHDHVGVQMRIPAPAGLVLIGDPDQTRQPLQFLHPGQPGCAPGCSRHARTDRPSPPPPPSHARRDRLLVTPSAPSARTSDTLFGAANIRSKPCTASARTPRPLAPFGATPSSSQRADWGCRRTRRDRTRRQTGQLATAARPRPAPTSAPGYQPRSSTHPTRLGGLTIHRRRRA